MKKILLFIAIVLLTLFSSNQLIAQSDTDLDGVPDLTDLDDDNDGILDVNECTSSNFYWSNPPTISGKIATGTINGIAYTYTSSVDVRSTSSVFAYNTFPASYNIPNANPTIQNIEPSSNTLSFASPMSNPVLVFSSIGGGPIVVPINFSAPVEILWSNSTVHQTSPTQITGQEGYAIVRMNGTFSSISFDYLVYENYVNFAFGADFFTYCDTDGDGITDNLDLDSDNDGCYDAIEGSLGLSPSQAPNGQITGGVDANGIPLAVGSQGQEAGASVNASANCFCELGIDDTDPTALAQNITIELDQTGHASISVQDIDAGSYDNCGISTITLSQTDFDCDDYGANNVTLNVTDVNGNSSSVTAVVNVILSTTQTVFNPSDFVNNGVSSYLGNGVYRLTSTYSQFGSVWYQNKMDLDQDFNLTFDVFLGYSDGGADGIAFVLQPLNTGQGSSGGGLGYMGISPSLSIEFDTWQNSGDPYADHVALVKNGDVYHYTGNTLQGPVSVGNLENGQYHSLSVSWNATTMRLTAVLDGSTVINYTGDIVNSIFGSNSGVYWGFTGATGGAYNDQRVKINTVSFVEQLTVSDSNVVPSECIDSYDGSIDITVVPEQPCYSYLWSNGETTQDISGLAPGNYTVLITHPSGLTTSETFTVPVNDVTDPTVITQNATLALDANGQATLAADDVVVSSTDNCTIESINLSQTSFDCSNLGNNTVDITAIDVNGNSTIVSASVTVIDNSAPVITVQPVSATLTASGTVSISIQDVLVSGVDNCGNISYQLSQTEFGASDALNSPVTVLLTGTDASGNTSTQPVEVTVIDPVPVAICQDITVDMGSEGSVSITPEMINNGSSSVVGIVSLSIDKSTFTCSDLGLNTVTLTVTSTLGSTATCTANVTITASDVDNDGIADGCDLDNDNDGILDINECTSSNFFWSNPPAISGKTATGTINGISYTYASTVNITSTSYIYNHGAFPSSYNVPNSNPTIQNIYPSSNTLTFASPMTNPVLVFSSIGNSGLPVTITFSNPVQILWSTATVQDSPNQITGKEGYAIVRMNGTFSSVGFDYLTYENWVNFVFGADFYDNCDSDNDGIADYLDLDSDNDGCFDAIEGSLGFSPDLAPNGMLAGPVDANGVPVAAGSQGQGVGTSNNFSANCFCELGIDDANPIALAQDITIELDENGQASITAQDIDAGSSDNCGIASLELDITDFDCSDINATTSAQSTLALDFDGVNDYLITNNPISHGSNFTYEAWVNIDAANDWDGIFTTLAPQATHLCQFVTTSTGKIRFEIMGASGGNTRKIYDGTTNILGAWHHVAATYDGVNLKLYVDGNEEVISAKIDDDVVGPLVVNKQFLMGSERNYGPRLDGRIDEIRIWNITRDASAIQAQMNKTLKGNEAGLIGYWPIEEGSGNTTEDITAAGNNFVMQNMNPSVAWTQGNVNVLPESGVEVTLTATDNVGNTSSSKAIVTVKDNMAPTVVTNDVTVTLDENGVASITTSMIDGGSYDNCSIESILLDITSFDCSNIGDNTVALTVVDGSGNVASAIATVTVEDKTSPVVLTQNTTVQLDANGAASIAPEDIDAGSTDACGIASLSLDVTSFDCSNIGENTVTLTAIDVNGNSASANAVVTVQDNIAPVVLTQNINVQLDANGAVSITTDDIDAGSSDACGIASLSLDITSFGCSNIGENTVTLTAVDVNGNSASATAIITVEDNVAPVVLSQDVILNLDANGTGSITVDFVDIGSSDACGIASMALSQTDFDCSNVGENTVTLTVTDVNGNVASATSLVTVYDVTAPDAVCQSVTLHLDANGQASIIAEDIDGGSTDACGIASIEASQTEFDCAHVGDNAVTLTVTDVNGNVSTCVATVTVINDIPEINTITVNDVTNIADVVMVQATYTDVNLASVSFDWGNGQVTSGTVDTETGFVYGEYLYAETGLYDVTVTITDVCGETASETYSYVVIYDPCAGHVTGGGYMEIGKAKNNFGFNAKYDKESLEAKGNVTFQNKVDGFKFKSEEVDWLMVNNDQAIFKGEGTINDAGNYSYIVSIIDGDVTGNKDIDNFRIIIWDENENVIYDNQPGDADAARANVQISNGSLKIHKGCNETDDSTSDTSDSSDTGGSGNGKGKTKSAYLTPQVTLYPNPVINSFRLTFRNLDDQPIKIDIADVTGRKYLQNKEVKVEGSSVLINIADLNLKNGNYMILIRNKDNSYTDSKLFIKK